MLVFSVRSASDVDERYTVTASNHSPSEWNCECPGYYYRETCRHIDACKDALIAGIESMRYEPPTEEPND
jgi:hypothetical protein